MSPEDWSAFRTETIFLKIELERAWISVVGVYRPPSVPKSQLTSELTLLFEEMSTITDKVFYAEISTQIHDGRLLGLFPAAKLLNSVFGPQRRTLHFK